MNTKKQDISQEQVRQEKPSTRFLYACGLAMRCLAINVRPVYVELLLERNGFGKGEAQEAVEQTKRRWDAMTPTKQHEIRERVRLRQSFRDTGLRRKGKLR